MIDDFKTADIILDRLSNVIPQVNEGGIIGSINERFRFLKYTKGNKLADHCDGLFPRNVNGIDERSVYTIHIYLNESEITNGGETIFYFEHENFKDNKHYCRPKKG